MKKPFRKFTVALVRYEDYEGESSSARILETFETFARSEREAISRVRFRNKDTVSLAHVGGGSHELYDDYEILSEDTEFKHFF